MIRSIVFRLLLIAALCFEIHRNLKLRPNVTAAAKIKHYVLLILFVLFDGTIWLGWTAGRLAAGDLQESIRTHFGPVGDLSIWVLMPLWFGAIAIGCMVLLTILGLARSNGKARLQLLLCFPLIVATDAFRFYLGFRCDSDLLDRYSERSVALISLGLFGVVLGWFYVWVLCFYRSRAADPIVSPAAESHLPSTDSDP